MTVTNSIDIFRLLQMKLKCKKKNTVVLNMAYNVVFCVTCKCTFLTDLTRSLFL